MRALAGLVLATRRAGHAIDRMTVEDLTPSVVRQFLDHLERDRHCSGLTRNQRLAMIRSLAQFIGMHSPAHLAWCSEVRSIPFKKTAKTSIGYLEKDEIDALLKQPDQRTDVGAQLLGKLQQSNLGPDNLLLGSLVSSNCRGGELRNPDQLRAPPRLAIRRGEPPSVSFS